MAKKNVDTSQEMDFKRYFCEKYFKKNSYNFDINYVDAVINNRGKTILYIEFKYILTNENDVKSALAQIVLTNKIQKNILSNLAVAYKDGKDNDILIFINCSDDTIMYHNDIKWDKEKRSQPSADAVSHIYNRIKHHLTYYKNNEIFEFYKNLIIKNDASINITSKNFNSIYNDWKNEIKFKEEIENEQDFISLFFVDILNNTKYEQKIKTDLLKKPLSFEGTDLNNYEITTLKDNIIFLYQGKSSKLWTIKNTEKYHNFWMKYKRPPEEQEFLKILERSAILYTDNYRRTTGAEYTPSCFVKLQNDILFNDNEKLNLDINNFIFFDPCAGVGNLENDFGIDYKNNCYLSTLEANDVNICKIKGFENVLQYDFLKKDKEFPKFYYQGDLLTVDEIAKKENKKLMIIMNPPYQKVKGKKNNLAIEFFNKCIKLKPDYIVFYYQTDSFFRDEINNYTKSKYSIISHIISNAKITFLLNEWSISQIIFSKENIESEFNIKNNSFLVNRYELNKKNNNLIYINKYLYDNSKPNLINEITQKIKENATGEILGQWSNLSDTMIIGGEKSGKNIITTNNLEYCLISKGINFNTHYKYFERNHYMYRGNFADINNTLKTDAIMFSLFYKKNIFSNKNNYKNYIMPFTAADLKDCGCISNNLYILNYTETDIEKNNSVQNKTFDFRQWLSKFEFSQEAKDLKNAALQIFKFYHNNNNYENKNFNDSFYDITNAIMGKAPDKFQDFDVENDTRINKTKTTKGTKGFGRNTIKSVIENADDQKIFYNFFDKRDILAKKINRQLVEQGLLLWERENIY